MSNYLLPIVISIVWASTGCTDSGVSVDTRGRVVPPAGATVCGGLAGAQCGADEVCIFSVGESCGDADFQGLCAKRPTTCAGTNGSPVCGCDGEVYQNACMANAAGVDIVLDTPRCR